MSAEGAGGSMGQWWGHYPDAIWNASTSGTNEPVTAADVQAVVDKLRIIPATIPPAERAQAIRDAVVETLDTDSDSELHDPWA